MSVTQFLFLLSMLGSGTWPTSGVDSPTAPLNLRQAEAHGLHRLNAAELKEFFPAAPDGKDMTGKSTKILKSDGAGGQKAFNDKPDSWRIDKTNHTYCKAFPMKQGIEESCFAVFLASDGAHYFGYDTRRGRYAYVWRRYRGI